MVVRKEVQWEGKQNSPGVETTEWWLYSENSVLVSGSAFWEEFMCLHNLACALELVSDMDTKGIVCW